MGAYGTPEHIPNNGQMPSYNNYGNYGYQNPGQNNKKNHGILIFVTVVATIALLSVLVKPSQPAAAKVNQPSATPQTVVSSPSKSEADTKPQTFGVGDTVKYNGLELTLLSIRKSKGLDYDAPKSGNEFVIVSVEYKNKGTENISYNYYDFKMKNSNGQITEPDPDLEISDTQLESGDLAPEGNVKGDIAFEEPIGDNNLVLQYCESIFSKKSVFEFKLN